MDDALSKALKRRDELREELARVEQFIALHNELFGASPDANVQVADRTNRDKSAKPSRKRGNPSAVADMAEKVIRSLGRPVQRGELVELIEAEGCQIESDDKPRYIGTILWRNADRFVNIEGQGYVMKGMEPGNGDIDWARP